MSEVKKTPDEVIADTPITKKMLDAVLDNRDVHLLNAIHEQQVKEFDSLKSALDQRFMSYDDSIKQLIDNDANIAGYFESLKKQGPAAEGGGGKIDIKDIGSTIRELVSAAREAGVLPGQEPSEYDRWGQTMAEIAKRESINAMKLSVRRAMRKGIIEPDIVEEMVGHTVEKAAGSHQPIL